MYVDIFGLAACGDGARTFYMEGQLGADNFGRVANEKNEK